MRLVAAVLVVIGAGLLAIAASFLLLDSGGEFDKPVALLVLIAAGGVGAMAVGARLLLRRPSS
jgi:hypothetical protein